MLVGTNRPQMITAVDLTIDELLFIADKLSVTTEFPICLGIHPNIFHDDVRARVREAVSHELTFKQILDPAGNIHPEVEALIMTAVRADSCIEARWYHTSGEGSMVRFAICRCGEDFLIIARSAGGGYQVVLQRISARVGVGGMAEAVVGQMAAASISTPIMGPVAELSVATTIEDLTRYGADSRSAQALLEAISKPESWVEFTATERLVGGTQERTSVSAGLLDSRLGRVVSIPRYANNALYGSFCAGTTDNIDRALIELTAFLPSGPWELPR